MSLDTSIFDLAYTDTDTALGMLKQQLFSAGLQHDQIPTFLQTMAVQDAPDILLLNFLCRK